MPALWRTLILLALLPACRTYQVTMEPMPSPLVNETSIAPTMKTKAYRKIMIVPPSGTVRGEFESGLASAERQFIKRGLTLISPAITGRVAILDTSKAESAVGGLAISDVERALVMARESNCEAVFQIGEFQRLGSQQSEYGTRYFVDRGENPLVECDLQQFQEAQGDEIMCWSFSAPVLRFSGRLVDVESGEVVASFLYVGPCVRVGDSITMTFNTDHQQQSSTYDWARKAPELEARMFDRMFASLAETIGGAN